METDRRLVVARTERIVSEEMGEEIVLYDLDLDVAHLLNAPSRRVYEASKGGTTVGSLLSLFPEVDPSVREAIVLVAVDDLRAARLVQTSDVPTVISRRQVLRTLGLAAIATPAIVSILAEPAAAVVSTGGICTNSAPCTGPGSGSAAGANGCCAGFFCPSVGGTCTAKKSNGSDCGQGSTGRSYECLSGCCKTDNPNKNTCQTGTTGCYNP